MKEKLKSFFDNYGAYIKFLLLLFTVFGTMFSMGLFDGIHYVRRSPVTATVTYKDDSSIRPIYVS